MGLSEPSTRRAAAEYGSVTPERLAALRAIVGERHLLCDRESLALYGKDETEDLCFPPDVVVKPATTDEVSELLAFAASHRLPVTPRGAGTGLSGGSLPVLGGISLSLERMNRIIEIDRRNLCVVTQPGVITEELQNAVEEAGLFYPPDPASRGSCFIGGNVAHGSGGPRAVKYGTTRDYLLGTEAVLPGGEVIRTGGKLRKCSAGYPVHQLLVSSEGTLAAITEISLKLVPKPAARMILLALFSDLPEALSTIRGILQEGVVPAAAEFLERDAIDAAASHLGETPPGAGAGALLLFEVDGPSRKDVERQSEVVGGICLEGGAEDVLVASEPRRQQRLWRLRRAVGEAVKAISAYREIDAVVPLSAIPELVASAKGIALRRGLKAICYGHAGDGNIHINVLKQNLPEDRWREVITATAAEVYRMTVSLGGAISGEHGVGIVGRGHLAAAIGEPTVALMRRIKAAFDPLGIMNPGKIF